MWMIAANFRRKRRGVSFATPGASRLPAQEMLKLPLFRFVVDLCTYWNNTVEQNGDERSILYSVCCTDELACKVPERRLISARRNAFLASGSQCSGTRHCKLFSLVESRNSAIRLAGTVYFAFVLPAFLTEKSPRWVPFGHTENRKWAGWKTSEKRVTSGRQISQVMWRRAVPLRGHAEFRPVGRGGVRWVRTHPQISKM